MSSIKNGEFVYKNEDGMKKMHEFMWGTRYAKIITIEVAIKLLQQTARIPCEGTLRSNAFKNGSIVDMKMYAQLKG